MEWERSILVSNGGTFRVSAKEKFDGLDGCLPHGSLVDGEVTYVVWLRCTAWVCFEKGIDDLLGGLEGTGCM